MAKKILASILAICLVLSTMCFVVSADSTTVTNETELAAALSVGGSIELAADIEVLAEIEVPAGVTAELDLNGYKITAGYQSDSTTKHLYPINNYGDLTIKDSVDTGSITGRGIYVQEGSKLTVESGSIYGIDSNGGSAIFQYGGDIVINGGLIEQRAEGTYNFAINAGGGTVTVNGGKVAGNHGAIATGGATVVINDGVFVCTGTEGLTDNVLYCYGSGEITINGGTFIGDAESSTGGACIYDYNGGTTVNNGNFSNSSGGDVWGTTGTTINGGTFENLTETQHITVGAIVSNGGEYYKKTEDGLAVAKFAKIGETEYRTIQDALDAVAAGSEANVVIDIVADSSFDITAWQTLAIGNDSSETITINGNGNTLTFNQLNSDWNNVATKNDAKLILNNMTIANSGYNNGPWNRYDINFACDVELNNVVSTKAMAFKADAALNNVTINESGDNYAIWIQPNGQTVAIDGLTINSAGRGIKIDEQYIDAPEKVALSVKNAAFTTAKKAAILVKSAAGADITASNFDISNVAADSVNLVWVDEGSADSYGKVNVTGATMDVEGGAESYSASIASNEGNVLGYYTTLQDAVAAANDGDTITLLADATLESANIKKDVTIDLSDNTLNVNAVSIMDSASGAKAAIQAWKDVTITNGNIVVTSASVIVNGVFYVASREDASLTISDVNLTAENTNGTDLFVSSNPGTLNIVDSVINANNISKLINGGDNGNAVISGSKINISDSERVMVNIALDADDSEINISNLSDNALRNVSGTITDTKIDANGYASGLKNDAGLALTVDGTSKLTFTGAADDEGEYDIYMKGGASLTVADTAVVYAEKTLFETPENVTGDVISKADVVSVEFAYNEEASDEDEGYKVYDIKVIGANSEVINRLNTADLTFVLSESKIAYEITPADKITLTTDADYADRYMFNFKGKDDVADTEKEIVIGQVKFTGYDSFTFGVKDVATNLVTATTIRDNIVDEFKVDNSTLVINEDTVTGDENIGSIDTEIVVPKRTLTVNVDFPNVVVDNAADYQAMTVTISGGDLAEDIVKNLGNADNAGNAADYTVTEDLTLNTAYTVTVKGAGYRTARYTVTMTEAKTLNFWNNVKDNIVEVEEGEAGSAVIKNFLAGDIVADNVINIYDLSAAVSYFTELVSSNADYIKYDLNRDGVIDSKDVAYILVSWGE